MKTLLIGNLIAAALCIFGFEKSPEDPLGVTLIFLGATIGIVSTFIGCIQLAMQAGTKKG